MNKTIEKKGIKLRTDIKPQAIIPLQKKVNHELFPEIPANEKINAEEWNTIGVNFLDLEIRTNENYNRYQEAILKLIEIQLSISSLYNNIKWNSWTVAKKNENGNWDIKENNNPNGEEFADFYDKYSDSLLLYFDKLIVNHEDFLNNKFEGNNIMSQTTPKVLYDTSGSENDKLNWMRYWGIVGTFKTSTSFFGFTAIIQPIGKENQIPNPRQKFFTFQRPIGWTADNIYKNIEIPSKKIYARRFEIYKFVNMN